jgi:hypothetical protein
MITKVLASAVIAVGVGVVVAAPAIADPYECRPNLDAHAFCGLSQSAPPQAGPAVQNLINQGIQNGLSDLHATQSHQ